MSAVRAFVLLTVAIAGAAPMLAQSAEANVLIRKEGISRLELETPSGPLTVEFTTHAIPAPKLTPNFPFDWKSNCTGSVDPCVVLDNVRVRVGKRDIFIPHSAYADCTDLGGASLSESRGIYVLSLQGGDASEAYRTTIRFNMRRILDRAVVALENQPYVVERTTYYQTPPLE